MGTSKILKINQVSLNDSKSDPEDSDSVMKRFWTPDEAGDSGDEELAPTRTQYCIEKE